MDLVIMEMTIELTGFDNYGIITTVYSHAESGMAKPFMT